jgi:hypothetical protein
MLRAEQKRGKCSIKEKKENKSILRCESLQVCSRKEIRNGSSEKSGAQIRKRKHTPYSETFSLIQVT